MLADDNASAAEQSIANVISTSNENISRLSKKVASTASALVSSDPGSHYQTAINDVVPHFRHPDMQRNILSLASTTSAPSEIVRSKLSTAEIQHRALTYIPESLLQDIPESNSLYSLFQGFQATVHEHLERRHHRRKNNAKLIIDSSSTEDQQLQTKNRTNLSKEKESLQQRHEMLGIRKCLASTEIKEIDAKIEKLNEIRAIVLKRLASLEMEEGALENQMQAVDNRLEDLGDLEDVEAIPEHNLPPAENEEFMSNSVYGKLSSPKARKRRAMRRKSIPILHEHIKPGREISDIACHTEGITCLDFDYPFGNMITASLDDTVRLWDLATGKCRGLLEGHQAYVKCLQMQNNLAATGSVDATIKLWDLSQSEAYVVPSGYVGSKFFGSQTNDNDEHGDIGQYSRGSLGIDCCIDTLDSHVSDITALHLQDETLVSGSADKTIRQWDLQTGRCIQTLDVLWAAAQSAHLVSVEETKTRLLSAGRDSAADFIGALQCFDAALACGTADGVIRLWDLRSGQVHRTLVGHTGAVTCLQFDEVHLITGSTDRSVRIWDLRTGSIFDAFAYDYPITSLHFDARRICTAAGEPAVKVYDRIEGRQWNCGDHERAVVEFVRCKEGYLAAGDKEGHVGIYSC